MNSNSDGIARMVARTGLGDFEVTASARGLRSVVPVPAGRTIAEPVPEGAALAHARAAAEALRRYAERAPEGYPGPFDLDAPAFPAAVWRELRAIPFGATVSYGEIAARLGVPGEARAVGAAVAANPVCVLIPCHRVVGADGSLKGFAWGLELKRRLLAHEAAGLPLFSG